MENNRNDRSEHPQSSIQWLRSPEYKAFYSNHFNFRFAPSDGQLTFSRFLVDPGGGTGPPKCAEEQFTVILAWPQIKTLAEYLNVCIKAMEAEVAPIPNIGVPKQEVEKQALAIIKAFGIQRTPKS